MPEFGMPKFLRISEVGELCGISESTVRNRVREGRLPPPVRMSERAVRWRLDDLEEALAAESEMMNMKDVMACLGLSRHTVLRMVKSGRLPEPERRGNATYWRRGAIAGLLAERRQRMEAIGQQIALANIKWDDASEERRADLADGRRRERVVLDLVTETDGNSWLEVLSGQQPLEEAARDRELLTVCLTTADGTRQPLRVYFVHHPADQSARQEKREQEPGRQEAK